MLQVPCYCPRCKTLSITSLLIEIAPEANPEITFSGAGTTCPNCRGIARIFDGTYTKNLINSILSLDITSSDIEKFIQIVNAARSKPTSEKEVAKAIENEVPKLSPLTAFLKYDFGLIPILSLIVSILSLIYAITQNNPKPPTVEEIINGLKSVPTKTQSNVQNKQTKKAKSSVNAPCICGSGKKYKKCCQSNER